MIPKILTTIIQSPVSIAKTISGLLFCISFILFLVIFSTSGLNIISIPLLAMCLASMFTFLCLISNYISLRIKYIFFIIYIFVLYIPFFILTYINNLLASMNSISMLKYFFSFESIFMLDL